MTSSNKEPLQQQPKMKEEEEENTPPTFQSSSPTTTITSIKDGEEDTIALHKPNGGSNTTTTASTFTTTSTSTTPHRFSSKICNSVLDCIGDTPLVRLNHIGSDLPCELLVKCEFFNAGGSVKDRIGKQMILDAERDGLLHPNDGDKTTTTTTLIEPTSGNTGIGLAMAACVKNYKCIITMPEKMSREKVLILKALGAEIIRTPTEAAHDAPDSHISVARRLQQELQSDAHILDQYRNPSNPRAHYEHTAEEIIQQLQSEGKTTLDMLVCGAGTGGTITGLSRRLKQEYPHLVVVGVDPEGSILAQPEELNRPHKLEPYHVEGIGYDFIPHVLDRTCVDRWIKTNDTDSLVMMRKLIRHEGLLCGGSSGAAVWAALQACRSLSKQQTCVIVLPDSVRNYMTKALDDDWMLDHGFVDHDIVKRKQFQTWWSTKHIADIIPSQNTPLTITADVTCKDAIALLKQEGFDMVPVLHPETQQLLGVVTEGNMTNRLLSGRATSNTTVQEAGVIYKSFHKFAMNDTLADLAHSLDHEPYALIVTEQRCFRGNSSSSSSKKKKDGGGGKNTDEDDKPRVYTRSVVSGIVTRIDLLTTCLRDSRIE